MSDKYLIEIEELYEQIKNGSVKVIDTRDPAIFIKSHIPNAINIPEFFSYLCTSETGGLQGLSNYFSSLLSQAGINRTDNIVIYEDALDNGYGQSCRGWFIFKYLGHPSSVTVLHGGFRAWNSKNLPTSTEIHRFERTYYSPAINSEIVVTKEEVLASINGSDGTIIVDVRDYAEWIGANSSPYGYDYCPRKGRIPGAKWLEWYRLMKRKGGIPWFVSESEIISTVEQAGISPKKPIIVYCFKGARTSNVMMSLLRAGLSVRNYFASWNEWSRDFSLPIEEDYPADSTDTAF